MDPGAWQQAIEALSSQASGQPFSQGGLLGPTPHIGRQDPD